MSTLHPRFRRLAAFSAALLLAACGGGGGGSTGPLPSFDTSAVAAADPGGMSNPDWRAGPFAEIFVRGYQDSDGDGIGDLKGLTNRLDYLKELGVTGIWLMPITRSQDQDHGYAVSDYRNVEAAYGSLADLDTLVTQAHQRGIGVVLDYVMNHSAAQHPAFVNANSGSSNAFRDWYVFSASKPSGWSIYGDPWRNGNGGFYFAVFDAAMPDFNLKNPTVVSWHQDNLRFWLNRGVDGFRFDAVGNLVENGPAAWENQPENFALMGNIRDMVGGSYANRFLVCEGPSAPLAFATACGSAFAFGHQSDLINAAKGNAAAITSLANYFGTAPAAMSTMLSNHDSFAGDRAMDQFNGNEAQYKLAAATYLLQPGTPFIYYGEEIGMRGGSLSGDPKLRTPMSWTSSNTGSGGFTTGTPFRALSSNVATNNVQTQQASSNSLLNWYKTVIAVRQANPALRSGTHVSATAAATTLSFQRTTGNQRAVVMINYGSGPALIAAGGLPANGVLTEVFPQPGINNANIDAGGTASASIPAQSLRVFVIAI